MTTLDIPAAEGAVVPDPEPVLRGTFALYQEPSGAMVLSYRLDNGQEGQRRIPRAMVKAGLKMAQREFKE